LRALSECQLHNPPVVVVDIDIPHEDELFTLLKEPSKYSLDNHPLITPVHGLNPHLFNGSSFCGGDKQPYSWQWKKKPVQISAYFTLFRFFPALNSINST
jgi:hypothetical protein